MSASLVVVLLMALTVTLAIAISMAVKDSEGSRTWQFEAKDPRQDHTLLRFEVKSNNYEEAFESANEVKKMYMEDGVDLEWTNVYEIDASTKEVINRVYTTEKESVKQ